ncbi:MAG: right-handed parallel beta-helix repeat-containing protein [Candidatus Thorarchaeota archaeon]|nr:right-handed parallel beta-helix repeat-containing protein [Candidatus Thorarchaeota archaeon]
MKLKQYKSRVLILLVITLLFAMNTTNMVAVSVSNDDGGKALPADSYVNHDFIAILGNEDFFQQASLENWDGSGTSEDPIIISGYRIQMARHLLRVVNTDLHFVFENNYLDGVDGTWCGLYLANATNGVIRNTIVVNSAISFHMINIHNCTMVDNILYDNYNEGVVLELVCTGNTIANNHIYNNHKSGILLDFGNENNIVANNTIHDNGGSGVEFWPDSAEYSAKDNIVSNNTISHQSLGISLQGYRNLIANNAIINSYHTGVLCGGSDNIISDNVIFNGRRDGVRLYSYAARNLITHNSIHNNTQFGVRISSSCDNNTISANDLIGNNVTQQTWDDGEGNIFTQNYICSWNAPDDNSDGIVDNAYPIAGESENFDAEPSATPNCELPSWYTYVAVSGTSNAESGAEFDVFLIQASVAVFLIGILLVLAIMRVRSLR